MKQYKKLIHKNREGFSENENRVFKKAIQHLKNEGWDAVEKDIYLDEDWGWVVLSTKQVIGSGVVLRRIKPVEITKRYTLETANNLQARLRKELVEVHPYKLKIDQHRHEEVEFLEPLFTLS